MPDLICIISPVRRRPRLERSGAASQLPPRERALKQPLELRFTGMESSDAVQGAALAKAGT